MYVTLPVHSPHVKLIKIVFLGSVETLLCPVNLGRGTTSKTPRGRESPHSKTKHTHPFFETHNSTDTQFFNAHNSTSMCRIYTHRSRQLS